MGKQQKLGPGQQGDITAEGRGGTVHAGKPGGKTRVEARYSGVTTGPGSGSGAGSAVMSSPGTAPGASIDPELAGALDEADMGWMAYGVEAGTPGGNVENAAPVTENASPVAENALPVAENASPVKDAAPGSGRAGPARVRSAPVTLEVSIPIDQALLAEPDIGQALAIRYFEAALAQRGAQPMSHAELGQVYEVSRWRPVLDGKPASDAQLHAYVRARLASGATAVSYRGEGANVAFQLYQRTLDAHTQRWARGHAQLGQGRYADEAMASFGIAHLNAPINLVNGLASLLWTPAEKLGADPLPQIPRISMVGDYGQKHGSTLELGAVLGLGLVAGSSGLLPSLRGALGGTRMGNLALGSGAVTAIKGYLLGAGALQLHDGATNLANDLLLLEFGTVTEGEVTRDATPEEMQAAWDRVSERLQGAIAGAVMLGAGKSMGTAATGRNGKGTTPGNTGLPPARVVTSGKAKGTGKQKPGSGDAGSGDAPTWRPQNLPVEVERVLGKRMDEITEPPPGTEIWKPDPNGPTQLRWQRGHKGDLPELTLDVDGRIALGTNELNRKLLGRNMRKLGAKHPDHHDHHIVPLEVAQRDPLFVQARERGKPPWDPNHPDNGIQLPTSDDARRAVADSRGLPLHNGGHPEYTRMARELANEAARKLTRQYGPLDRVPPAELTRAAKQVQRDLRAELQGWLDEHGDKL